MNFCTNCGAALSANVRFCAGCGAPADAEITRLASANTAYRPSTVNAVERQESSNEVEQIIFTVRPTLLFIVVGYIVAALSAILLTGVLAYAGLPFVISLFVSLPIFLIPAFRHLKRNTVSYTLSDSKVEIAQGVLVRKIRSVPLRSIQDVTVSATILQRLLGFGDIAIDDASEQGGASVSLRNIPDPNRHADSLLRQLRRWR